MLLPHQLAGMRLGLHPAWRPGPVAPRVGLTRPAPAAYSRIISAPRVAGHNDQIGDCFPTACTNAVQTFLARSGDDVPIADAVAVDIYEDMTGYNPANPASDQGTDPDSGFAWWQRNSIAGYRLAGLTQIDPKTEGDIRSAIALTGGVLLCVELAVEQQNEIVWTATGTPGSWGGHAIWCDGYEGDLTFATSWGEAKPIDRSYFEQGFVAAVYVLELERT